MAQHEDLIDFEIIETSKENIQPLPSGRSAKALAQVFSPVALKSPLSQTQTANDALRAEYEKELATIDDSDDPLDVYDRYVKWTLDAYPSAQATPQSRLLPLLERATKAFLSSTHYKNDPRYLKLWLHYIRLFSDAPRETFAYLARHNVGDGLALFYEEFAAWLEGAGRWKQAEEVYKMGIEKEARPTERLMRKFGEFEKRLQARPEQEAAEPSSPALPTVRPALMAKHDPFSVASPASTDPQAADRAREGPARAKNGKLEIFSDANDEHARPSSNDSVKGWETIGSLAERKKENVMAAKPWQGEGMKGMPTNLGVPKMPIFKDPTLQASHPEHPFLSQRSVNPRTGKPECVFVPLDAVYPDPSDPSVEYTFEELRAAARGWLQKDWKKTSRRHASSAEHTLFDLDVNAAVPSAKPSTPADVYPETFERTVLLNDENAENGRAGGKADVARKIRKEERANRTRKIKVKEVKASSHTQTIQANLDSPKSSRPKKKKDPTMTMISRAAMDEVYDLFNQPLKSQAEASDESEEESEEDESDSGSDSGDEEDEYTTDGESTATGRLSAAASEYGDETQRELGNDRHASGDEATATLQSNAEWTGFTSGGGVLGLESKSAANEAHELDNDNTEDKNEDRDEEENRKADDDEADTQQSVWEDKDDEQEENDEEADKAQTQQSEAFEEALRQSRIITTDFIQEDVKTPTSPTPASVPTAETRYIPVRPEDYDAPTRPWRDAAQIANSRLPFMTPIAEKTESSLGTITHKKKGYFGSKTPCPGGEPKTPISKGEGGVWSSPFEEVTKDVEDVEDPEDAEDVEDADEVTGEVEVEKDANEVKDATKEDKVDDNDEKEAIPPVARPKMQHTPPPAKHQLQHSPPVAEPKMQHTPPPVTQLKMQHTPPVAKAPIVVPKPQLKSTTKDTVQKGPIIKEAQCNPMDPTVQQTIVSQLQPPISYYEGYFEHPNSEFGKKNELRKQCKAIADAKSKSRDRSNSLAPQIPNLEFEGTTRAYTVRRELGKGAYAPVYLVEGAGKEPSESDEPKEEEAEIKSTRKSRLPHSHHRRPLEALKMQDDPPSAWEFYMISIAHRRLGVSRAAESIVRAHECHIFKDESYLVEEYRDQGTILDAVNFVSEQTGGAMDETLAMFFAVELLRLAEGLHSKGIIHGDLKPDNVLIRLEASTDVDLNTSTSGETLSYYEPSGGSGWSSRGVTLIDFGRGIDMKSFIPNVQFIADWKTSSHDCPEMRELRPWTYQADYHGLAGILYALLFGKYMDPPVCEKTGLGPTGTKTYRLKDPLKRYWATEIWAPAFDLLLNSAKSTDREEGQRMPILRGLKDVRQGMEKWLVTNGEKGIGLRAWVRRIETWAQKRRGR